MFIIIACSLASKNNAYVQDFSFNSVEAREVENFSYSGFSNAKNLARLYSILVNGGTYEGKTLMKG